MKIIDFAKHGNVVRFYLGNDDLEEYYGDDWDDAPYEHNADTVYDKFIAGYIDFAFPFDWIVLEPCDGTFNSRWCKDDFVDRKTPCLIAVPTELWKEDQYAWRDESYSYWVGNPNVYKFYFGDNELDYIKHPALSDFIRETY